MLFALDARTGKPVQSFGKNGKVSMNIGLRDDPETISVIPTSPGIVFMEDLLIMGAEVSELYGAATGIHSSLQLQNRQAWNGLFTPYRCQENPATKAGQKMLTNMRAASTTGRE